MMPITPEQIKELNSRDPEVEKKWFAIWRSYLEGKQEVVDLCVLENQEGNHERNDTRTIQ